MRARSLNQPPRSSATTLFPERRTPLIAGRVEFLVRREVTAVLRAQPAVMRRSTEGAAVSLFLGRKTQERNTGMLSRDALNRQRYRFLSKNLWKALLGIAPVILSAIWPFLNRMKVGTLMTLNL